MHNINSLCFRIGAAGLTLRATSIARTTLCTSSLAARDGPSTHPQTTPICTTWRKGFIGMEQGTKCPRQAWLGGVSSLCQNSSSEFILEPGEVLYLPRGWTHFVENITPALMLNVWRRGPAAITEQWLEDNRQEIRNMCYWIIAMS